MWSSDTSYTQTKLIKIVTTYLPVADCIDKVSLSPQFYFDLVIGVRRTCLRLYLLSDKNPSQEANSVMMTSLISDQQRIRKKAEFCFE